MNLIAYGLMYSALPIMIVCFLVLPARRAVVVLTIAYWLYFPQAGFSIPGFPDYTKVSVLNFGLVLCTFMFAPQQILRLRLRWYDLAMLVWCLVPIASSLSNGLGLYDGVSGIVYKTILWGFPYLIGRAYFGDQAGLQEFARGIVVGGLSYVPLCFYEIRMSPYLHTMIFGFAQRTDFATTRRLGGYRPLVFLASGLEVGMYMAAATVAAYGLWISGNTRRILQVPMGLIVAILVVTTILCKSSGAILIMLAGLGTLWLARRTKLRAPLWCLVIVAPVFLAMRAPNLLDTEPITRLSTKYLGEDRAGSFAYRVRMEDAMMVKIFQRPLLGWAWAGRAFIRDEKHDVSISVPDSLWIIAVGQSGFVGLIAITAVQVLPCLIWLIRYAKKPWCNPESGASATLVVVLTMYAIDNLLNAMHSPMYYMIAGGLMSAGATLGTQSPRDLLAKGRSYKEKNQFIEAASVWSKAIGLAAAAGHTAQNRQVLADLNNDLAWLMCSDPTRPTYDPIAATHAASRAIEAYPEHPAAWNTLGVARLRSGDFAGAVQALQRSIELGGGDAFDQFPLAMAHRGLGQREEADRHLKSAILWTQTHRPDHPDLLRFWAEAVPATTMTQT